MRMGVHHHQRTQAWHRWTHDRHSTGSLGSERAPARKVANAVTATGGCIPASSGPSPPRSSGADAETGETERPRQSSAKHRGSAEGGRSRPDSPERFREGTAKSTGRSTGAIDRHGPVVTGGGEGVAISGKGQPVEFGSRPLNAEEFLPGGDVPEPDGPVPPT